MNRTETLGVMALVSTYWPHWRIPADIDEAEAFVRVWERMVGDLESDTVIAAVDSLAVEGERFAPGPGVVRNKAVSLTAGAPAPTEDEAWMELKEQISRVGSLSRYEVVDRAASFSHPAVEAVVNALGWRELCESENEVADRAHFTRLYRERLTATKNRDALPASVAAITALAESKRLDKALGGAS